MLVCLYQAPYRSTILLITMQKHQRHAFNKRRKPMPWKLHAISVRAKCSRYALFLIHTENFQSSQSLGINNNDAQYTPTPCSIFLPLPYYSLHISLQCALNSWIWPITGIQGRRIQRLCAISAFAQPPPFPHPRQWVGAPVEYLCGALPFRSCHQPPSLDSPRPMVQHSGSRQTQAAHGQPSQPHCWKLRSHLDFSVLSSSDCGVQTGGGNLPCVDRLRGVGVMKGHLPHLHLHPGVDLLRQQPHCLVRDDAGVRGVPLDW